MGRAPRDGRFSGDRSLCRTLGVPPLPPRSSVSRQELTRNAKMRQTQPNTTPLHRNARVRTIRRRKLSFARSFLGQACLAWPGNESSTAVRSNQTTEFFTDPRTPHFPLLFSSPVAAAPSSHPRASPPTSHNHPSRPVLVSPQSSALLPAAPLNL